LKLLGGHGVDGDDSVSLRASRLAGAL
jgi:hypothetical protein